MSLENFHRFRELVLTDQDVQKQIRDIDDREEFISRVVELAKSNGFEFDSQTVADEMMCGKREWIERWI